MNDWLGAKNRFILRNGPAMGGFKREHLQKPSRFKIPLDSGTIEQNPHYQQPFCKGLCLPMSVEPLSISERTAPSRTSSNTIPAAFILKTRSIGFWPSLGMSLGTHLGVAFLILLVMFVAQLLGLDIPLFAPPSLKEREITFVLVENPKAPPRDKKTLNRAEHETRAGGQKVKNQPQAEPRKKAGAPTPNPPSKAAPPPRAASKPQPKAQPRQQKPQKRPTRQKQQQVTRVQEAAPQPQASAPTPEVVKTPSPPQPKLQRPVTSKVPTPYPSVPFRPSIKIPASGGPQVASVPRGPLVTTSGGSSRGSGQSGSPAPSQIPGGTSMAGSPGRSGSAGSPGGVPGGSGRPSGSGGYGNYNQAGSPGGGGGRPGIDALPEPDYGAYMAELQRRIKRNWRPPTAQEDKRVVVLFKILRDGRLSSITVKESSGYSEADNAAMGAVRLSAPFRPLPPNHPDSDLSVQFTFDYNVYKSSGGGVTQYR